MKHTIIAMANKNPIYSELNSRWKAAAKLLFGDEVEELSVFEKWLSDMRAEPLSYHLSSISGRSVAYSTPAYDSRSKWMSFDEVDLGKRFEPLSSDDLGSLDSLVGAVGERAYFTGNVVLGHSAHIEASSNVSDSFYVYGSTRIGDSKYVAYTSLARLCENVFGCAAPGESSYMVRCNDTYQSKRCFELWQSVRCSDCYYVFNLNDCSDCILCFGLRNARYCIANKQLSREQYTEIKATLLSQMRDELKEKKRLPSLLDFIRASEDHTAELKASLSALPPVEKEANMTPIQNAFSQTCKIVLGFEPHDLPSYQPWLSTHGRASQKRRSPFSGQEIFVGDYANYFATPAERTVTEIELIALSKLGAPKNVSGISLSNAASYIGKIAYLSLEYYDGQNTNIIDCMSYADSRDCLNCFPLVGVRDSAFNFWPRSSDHVFGCSVVFDSSYCINCHQSVKLTRCFEADSCRDCSDLYFCHNCEGCQECLFCFNVKSKRYAIGNVEYPKEGYLRVKKMVLGEIGRRLQKDKRLDLSIFNVGSQTRP